MTAQELKNSILQLAVQGKLVPQDKNDEPASELLKRIQVEKARLIKEGRYIPDKKHTAEPIKDDDILYDLPDNWVWVRFADMVAFNSGKTPQRQNTSYWNNNAYPWVSIADMIADGCTYTTKESVSQKAIRECFSEKISPAGTLIMSFKLTIGKVSILGTEAVHNEAIISIYPFACGEEKTTLQKYLFKVLPLIAETGNSKNAIKGKTLNATSISNLLIPLPPLTEQQRIVEKIEELLPLVEEYGKAETCLKELNADFPDMLRKSILQQAVQGKLTERNPADEPASELLKRIQAEKAQLIKDGKLKKEKPLPPITEDEIPFDIPDTWEWVRFNDITEVIGDGIHGTPIFDGKGEYYFVNGNNLIDGKIVFKENTQKVSKGEYELYKKPLNSNTVLLSINGTIGNIAYYNSEPIILGKSACYIALLSAISKEYIRIILGTKLFLDYAVSKATKTTIANVSLKAMRMFPVPLPPLEEQKRIVARVEELLALCDQLK